jgi:ATP-dependent helicase IRC3
LADFCLYKVIFTQLIDRIKPRQNDASQTLILVHRKELVEQAARHCKLAYPDKTIDIEMANSHATGAADITIASIRSMLSKARMQKFDPKKFKLVLVDEAHHIVAPTYRQVLEYLGLHKPSPDAPALVGVSATFSRFDGLRLGAAIDHIVYHKDYIDMIGEKWLADAVFTTVKSRVDLSKVEASASGDFNPKQLSAAVNTETTNDITLRAWLSRAQERKSTLIFCVDISHVKALTAKFRQAGIDARYITSQSSKDLRTRELDSFRNQEYPVLLNCGLFTEGTDIPNIDCVVLARPTRSKNLLIQMIGRGLRLHPGKENCHIIDMVASLETGVLTTPTLLGLDPDEGLDKAGIEDVKKIREAGASGFGRPKPDYDPDAEVTVTLTDYDSVQDLLQDSSSEAHIRSISGNAWIRTGKGRYVLSAPGGRVTITADESGRYSVHHYQALSSQAKVPFSRAREIAFVPDFTQAVHAADTFANRVFGSRFIGLWQPWRKKPASPEQLDFLKKRLGLDEGELSDDITKGQATDMIAKLKYGAKGQFKKLLTAKRSLEREKMKRLKMEELREREEVRVGPLQ